MGSSGSGRFSDYSGTPKQTGSDGNSSGGGSGKDPCGMAFSTGLEDLEQQEFFQQFGTLPLDGDQLSLAHRGRIVAVSNEGLVVGALPTKFNYLAACLKDGFRYVGIVTRSASKPVARLDADFAAS